MVKVSGTILLLVAILIFGQIAISPRASAQSTTRLNSEISSLRGRVNRLEAEIRRLSRLIPQSNLSRQDKPETPTSNRNQPEVIDGEIIGRSDPTVENLSILLIELKEDVKSLDGRVADIEAKIK